MKIITVGQISNNQSAFIVDYTDQTIYISKSGHMKIFVDAKINKANSLSGGWIQIRNRKLTLYSGSFGSITEETDDIIESLETFLGIIFRYVRY